MCKFLCPSALPIALSRALSRDSLTAGSSTAHQHQPCCDSARSARSASSAARPSPRHATPRCVQHYVGEARRRGAAEVARLAVFTEVTSHGAPRQRQRRDSWLALLSALLLSLTAAQHDPSSTAQISAHVAGKLWRWSASGLLVCSRLLSSALADHEVLISGQRQRQASSSSDSSIVARSVAVALTRALLMRAGPVLGRWKQLQVCGRAQIARNSGQRVPRACWRVSSHPLGCSAAPAASLVAVQHPLQPLPMAVIQPMAVQLMSALSLCSRRCWTSASCAL